MKHLNLVLILSGLLAGMVSLILAPSLAKADFPVANTTAWEGVPSVATNTRTNDFLVAYRKWDAADSEYELRVQRFNSAGVKQGGVIAPLFTILHNALGRPAIAYNYKYDTFLVAFPNAANFSGNNSVLTLLLDGKGNTRLDIPNLGWLKNLFDDGGVSNYYPGNDGVGDKAIRVVHNSVLDEFLVTYQRQDPQGAGNNIIGYTPTQEVVAQRIRASDGALVSSQLNLFGSTINGFSGHAIAHAPVQTNPIGGYYLVTGGRSNIFSLRDKNLDIVYKDNCSPNDPPIGLWAFDDLGKPDYGYGQFDIAYGRVQGKDRFLIVWWDENNCIDSKTSCTNEEMWTGVWGTYFDPSKTTQCPEEYNVPFPISSHPFEHSHYFKGCEVGRPRVTYNADALGFFVVWRDLPGVFSGNDEFRSHIRGNWVDYLVDPDDPATLPAPDPYQSVVISDVSGNCPSQTSCKVNNACLSLEDPTFPDVAAIGGLSVAVVWQQHFPFNTSNIDILGDTYTATAHGAARIDFDFDGDGKADILWRNSSTSQVYIWLMNGTSIKSAGSAGSATSDWVIQEVGDCDGDGMADILWRNLSTGQTYIWLMNGTSIKSHGSAGGATSDWVIQEMGDCDGDGMADILWRNSITGQTYIWLMNGTSIKSAGSAGSATSDWVIQEMGDCDGDGMADILWRNSNTGQTYIWCLNGTSIKSAGSAGSATSDWVIQEMGDCDGDGMADILWRNTNTGQVYIWCLNGTSVKSAGSAGSATSDWVIQEVGDYDGDGKTDILWRNSSTGQTYIWLMNGTSIKSHGSAGGATSDWVIVSS